MTTELNKLRTDLIFGSLEWTIRYCYTQEYTEGRMSLLVKRPSKGTGKIDIGCPSECDIVNILKQANPKISAEAVGSCTTIYGYRLFWEGDVIQSLEYDLSVGEFKSIVLAPKTISNF